MTTPEFTPITKRVCKVEGCTKKHFSQNLCQAHYKEVWRKTIKDQK